MRRFFLVLILFLLVAACEQKIPKDTETESALEVGSNNESLTSSSDPAKGKTVYYANCTSCHNYNPKTRQYWPRYLWFVDRTSHK